MTSTVGRTWNSGMMSSIRQDWATPRQLFEMLSKEFHFTLDVCATLDTAVCEQFLTAENDSLALPWTVAPGHTVWMNPPYGRKIGDWIERAYRESTLGVTVVCLLPGRTDTQWFHDYCLKGEIRFLRGRLNFDDKRPSRAPFPSMLVIFRGRQS